MNIRTVAVSCDCQTAPMAECLAYLLPNDRVVAALLPAPDAGEAATSTKQTILAADIWVHTPLPIGHPLAVEGNHGPSRIAVPLLMFDAFHPDLTYLWDTKTNTVVSPHYNSAIVAWAYLNGVSTSDLPALFCHEVFADLGYFSQWSRSVKHLASLFSNAGFGETFGSYFLALQRTGVFMHSVNHPKAYAIVGLAGLVAERLGAIRPSVMPSPFSVHDWLAGGAWPVYPLIADALGLEGGAYKWHHEGRVIAGVGAYADAMYARYRTLGLTRDNTAFGSFEVALLDRVLRPHAKG
jgi:hypothetical protein